MASHQLVKQLMDDLKPVFERINPNYKKQKSLLSKSPVDVSPSEYYTWNVFSKASAIHDAARRMEHAIQFVGTFPNATGYEKKGITRDKWIEYHFSYFKVNLASIQDLCLLLTNTIFRLGMPERLCSLDSITKNEWVAETDTPKTLRALDKIIEEHRTIRNLHVHRGQVPNISEVLGDDLFSHLSVISFVESINSIGFDRAALKQGYRAATKDLKARIQDDITSVLNGVIIVYDSLLIQYSKNIARIRTGDITH